MSDQMGFIGLGAMGLGMCRNLLAAGISVVGYDVDPLAVDTLAAAGGIAADSPAAVAREASLIAVCVLNSGQAEQVLFGTDGAAAALPTDAVVVMHTTMAPKQVKALAARLAAGNRTLVDAPVTGGKASAEAGTQTIIAAGPAIALARCRPAFEAMSARIYCVGDTAGSAASVKMINQLLVGVHMVATGEAIALAAKAGADPKTVYDVVTHGGGNSTAFQSRGQFMIAGDFEPRGALDLFVKDLGIVADTAAALEFPLPLGKAALAQFRAASDAGYGRQDAAAVVKLYERDGNVTVGASSTEQNTDDV